MSAPAGPHVLDQARDLRPAPGSQPWQHRFLGWMNRRKRLSVLVPVFVLVLGTPHSCPFC